MRKRFAFTLAEILVVIVIIAVIATVITNIKKTSKTKIDLQQYYIAYNTVTKASKEVQAIYGTAPFKNTNGLCQCLSKVLNTVGMVNCDNIYKGSYDSAYAVFSTGNGLRFFQKDDLLLGSGDLIYFRIYVDINGDDGKGVEKRDVFGFDVYPSGKILPSREFVMNNFQAGVTKRVFSTTEPPKRTIFLQNLPVRTAICKLNYLTGDEHDTYCVIGESDTNLQKPHDDCLVDKNACRLFIYEPLKGF